MATPSSTPEQQRDAIRETLRLVGDLSDALATQLGRVQRLSGELSSPPSTGVGSALADDAARIKQHCEQLRDELDRQQAREQPVPSADAAPSESPEPELPGGGDDAVRSLAIEMKLEGRSQTEVKEYLGSTFGRDDASRIVEDVFAGET
ncbi:MAG: hypothetical protein M3Z33_02085 [Actinomycetota bacterium]|nr:hypothetical protein [Actinomycetota bacterium]